MTRLLKPRWLANALGMGVAIALMLTVVSSAEALTIRISDGSTTVTLSDGDLGDLCGAAGCVTFSGAVGDFSVNVTTGLSKPILPGSTLELDSLQVFVNGSAPNTLTIELTDTGFIPGTGTNQLVSSFSLATFVGTGTVSASQCAGFDDAAFDCSPGATVTHSTFSAPGSQTLSTSFTTGTQFSLTETVVLAFSGAVGVSSLSFTSAVIPQPHALLLLGLGLAALGALPMWRARRAR